MNATALVVGGSSAIGRATAVALAQEGFDVTLWGRDASRLARSRDAVVAAGAAVQTVSVDVTVRADLAAHPERLLSPEDVAAAVRFVVGSPRGRPTEIRLEPQSSA